MKVICTRCDKSFVLLKTAKIAFENDGLCGKCRSRKNYLEKEKNTDHKTSSCPECGKPILPSSEFCSSCSQKGERGNRFIDGHSGTYRNCNACGKRISNKSKGLCSSCYTKTLFGEGNTNYKTGFYANKVYNTREYVKWKLNVLERDKRICALCNDQDKGHSFHAHHILPKRDYPELILDLDNGITLCRKCHASMNNNEMQYVEILQSKIKQINMAN